MSEVFETPAEQAPAEPPLDPAPAPEPLPPAPVAAYGPPVQPPAYPAPVPPYPAPGYPAPGYGYAPQGAAPVRGGMSPRVRVALRWTTLLLVFAVFGAGAAYAVTRPERTKIPGLATPDDGRWTFPQIALPQLPARKPRPLDDDANPGGIHYADLRSLLVPQPEGAVRDASLPGAKGWLPTATYLKDVRRGDGGAGRELDLKENGLRHIAARGWSMPDGTRVQVYLVQFVSAPYTGEFAQDEENGPPQGVDTDKQEPGLHAMVPDGVEVDGYSETPPYGDSMTRFAFLTAGDTMALVQLTRKGGVVPEQAFKQTVALQAQLLG